MEWVIAAWVVGIPISAVVGYYRGNWALGACLAALFGPLFGPPLTVFATRDGDNQLRA